MEERLWFAALVPGGHVGAGRVEEKWVYLYATDIVSAQKIARTRVRGWKRSRGVISLSSIDAKAAAELEARIAAIGRGFLEKVKREGYYYGLRPDEDITSR